MIRPLLFMAHLQQEEGMKTRKALQKAISHRAKLRAAQETPRDFLAYQKAIDEDLGDILLVAAERMDILLREPTHFLKKKTEETMISSTKVPLVQQRKDMISYLLQRPDQQGHDWQPHRSGAQCKNCRTAVHAKSMLQEIKKVTETACAAPLVARPVKTPRMTVIQQLLEAQDRPQAGVHFLKLDKAYSRCTQCRAYTLARTSQTAFDTLGEPCLSGPLPPSMWNGSQTHTMVRCGCAQQDPRRHSGDLQTTEGSLSMQVKRLA